VLPLPLRAFILSDVAGDKSNLHAAAAEIVLMVSDVCCEQQNLA
jgi:hypothetical protein